MVDNGDIAPDLNLFIPYKDFKNMEEEKQLLYMRHWRKTKTNDAIFKGMGITSNTLHRLLMSLNLLGKKGVPVRHDNRGHTRFMITEDVILTYEEFKALDQDVKMDLAKTLFKKFTVPEIAKNWGVNPQLIYSFRSYMLKNGSVGQEEVGLKRIKPKIIVVLNYLVHNNSLGSVDVLLQELHRIIGHVEGVPDNVCDAYESLSENDKWLLMERIVSKGSQACE